MNKLNTMPPSVVLAIVLTALKLIHVIAWSWWWVLAPIWISVIFYITIGFIIGFIESIRTHRGE